VSPHVDAADWPVPPTPLYAGLLEENGAWLRDPRGGVEDVAEMKACGREWLALNVGDHPPSTWGTVRLRAERWNVEAFPWRRTRTAEDVRDLVAVGLEWGAAAVGVNLEKEAETGLPPTLVNLELKLAGWPGEVVLITEAWLYNAVDWAPLTRWPVVSSCSPPSPRRRSNRRRVRCTRATRASTTSTPATAPTPA